MSSVVAIAPGLGVGSMTAPADRRDAQFNRRRLGPLRLQWTTLCRSRSAEAGFVGTT